MNREVVETFCKIAQKLSYAKKHLSILAENHPAEYFKVREELFDCQELMALFCNCAPIKLIAGKVDDIIENIEADKEAAKIV